MPATAVHRRRWTRADYERMVEAGGFRPDDRIELLDGEIWEMSPQGTRHETALALTAAALQQAFPKAYVRHQLSFGLDEGSVPEPDLAVVSGTIRDYAHSRPTEALLIAEVSDSSLRHDRTRKLAAYARNGIPEYWILDLQALCLEVYRGPSGPCFSSKIVLRHGDTVMPLHASDAVISVADLLP